MEKRQYDIALSFAGEDRQYAERLAELLTADGYSVFYDEYERAELWGKDLYTHLSSVYKDQADYCVMFLSEHYAQKLWPNHERQNAQARAFQENKEYILPIRLDDTEIPGILPTVGYLDLRTTSIEEIYQDLVKKLSGTTSQGATTDTPTSTVVESDPGEFALLHSRDGRRYFMPVQSASWASTEISLELLPESLEESAFLRSLMNDSNPMVRHREIFAFALGVNAAWVNPQDITQTMSGSQTVWKVVLQENSRGQDFNLDRDATFGNISADQIAEMRAKRILLNKKLEPARPSFNLVDELNQQTLELLVCGHAVSEHDLVLEVPESPIPYLYQSFGQTRERFQKFARLASVLYLKLSGTIGDVLQLDLKLLDSKQLQVRFKGRRPRATTTTGPAIIEVDGICPL